MAAVITSGLSADALLGLGLIAVFVALVVAFSIIGVVTAERRQIARSLDTLKAFTAAPPELRKEHEEPFKARVLIPALARFTNIGRSFTPDDQVRRIQHRLDLAGNPEGWDVDRIVGLKIVGFLAGLVIGVIAIALLTPTIVFSLILGVGLAMAGFFAPNMWVYQKGYERSEQMRKDLPDSLDLLTISVEAGLGFDAALARVARDTEGPLAAEFARVLQEMNIGEGRSLALRAMGERTQIPELKGFVTAMVQADALGIPIAHVLRVQSSEMRTKRRQRAEEMAQKVPIKILFPLIFFILPTLFIAVLGPGVITIVNAFFGTVK